MGGGEKLQTFVTSLMDDPKDKQGKKMLDKK